MNNKSSTINAVKTLHANPELMIEMDDYNINVTSNHGEKISAEKLFSELIQHDTLGDPIHLYFHVPLCAYVCHFCNYVKKLSPENEHQGAELDKWTRMLIQESQLYLDSLPWMSKVPVDSFYIGGGTGSILGSERLAKLLGHVQKNYNLVSDCEINLEGNPDNFLNDELKESVRLGFNRFSVGVQSLQSEVNVFAGRKHNAEMSMIAIEKLNQTNCPYNIDMMFGLPFQTVDSVRDDIKQLIKMGVPTITIYRLRNADRKAMAIGNTAVWNRESVKNKLIESNLFPGLEVVYEMREAIMETLLSSGYYPSPCGWWSKSNVYPEGNIPRISKNKWQNYQTMIAHGPGAYGWITDRKTSKSIQTHNILGISQYARSMEEDVKFLPLSHGVVLNSNESLATRLGFAYKSNQPIYFSDFEERFGIHLMHQQSTRSIIKDLEENGFIHLSEDSFRPTIKGETFHEEIISKYFHERIGNFNEVICKR